MRCQCQANGKQTNQAGASLTRGTLSLPHQDLNKGEGTRCQLARAQLRLHDPQAGITLHEHDYLPQLARWQGVLVAAEHAQQYTQHGV